MRVLSIFVVALIATVPSLALADERFMTTAGHAWPPQGHADFCADSPEECVAISPTEPVKFNAVITKLRAVNRAVNTRVREVNDEDGYDTWTYPIYDVGDCEDFVLEKRRLLSKAGISLSTLLITLVMDEFATNGLANHAVLTVRTDRGDFILDNRTNSVKEWRDTGYEYTKRQSERHAGRWVPIVDSVQTGATN